MKGLILWSDSYFGDTVIEIRIVDCKSDIYGYYLQQKFSNLAIWSHKTRKAIEILFRRGFPVVMFFKIATAILSGKTSHSSTR